jgi:hypothetical protein
MFRALRALLGRVKRRSGLGLRAFMQPTRVYAPDTLSRQTLQSGAGCFFQSLSKTITLETKALTSRICVRPQALAIAPKSSLT